MFAYETRRWRSSATFAEREASVGGAVAGGAEKGASGAGDRWSVSRHAAPSVAASLPPLPERVARVLRAPGAARQGARLLPAGASVPGRAAAAPAAASTPKPAASSPVSASGVCVSLPAPRPLAVPRPRGQCGTGAQWWGERPLPEPPPASSPPRQGEPPQATLHGEPPGHEAAASQSS